MLLALVVPRLGEGAGTITVEKLNIAAGSAVVPGTALVDLRVDFRALAPQDCPPVSYYRLTAREKGWVRQLHAPAGAVLEVGAVLAVVGTEPDEADGPPTRNLRISTVSVLVEPSWLSGNP